MLNILNFEELTVTQKIQISRVEKFVKTWNMPKMFRVRVKLVLLTDTSDCASGQYYRNLITIKYTNFFSAILVLIHELRHAYQHARGEKFITYINCGRISNLYNPTEKDLKKLLPYLNQSLEVDSNREAMKFLTSEYPHMVEFVDNLKIPTLWNKTTDKDAQVKYIKIS